MHNKHIYTRGKELYNWKETYINICICIYYIVWFELHCLCLQLNPPPFHVISYSLKLLGLSFYKFLLCQMYHFVFFLSLNSLWFNCIVDKHWWRIFAFEIDLFDYSNYKQKGHNSDKHRFTFYPANIRS